MLSHSNERIVFQDLIGIQGNRQTQEVYLSRFVRSVIGSEMHSPAVTIPKQTLTHLLYIDALRGIAFLGVLTIHTGLQCPGIHFFKVAMAGSYGVQLFFLLSAITLFRSLDVRSAKEDHPVRNFYVRRLFRIAPLFWIAIVYNYFSNGVKPTDWAPTGLHLWQFIATTLFVHGWAPSSINSVVPGGWSMAVEITFYAVLPLIYHRVSNVWAALSTGFMALASGAIVSKIAGHILFHNHPADQRTLIETFLRFWFPAQLCIFLFGAAVFYVLKAESVSSFAGDKTRACILVMAGAYTFFGLSFVDTDMWLPVHVLSTLAFVPIILGLATYPFGLLVNPLTRGLGTISYSCYLTHFPILQAVRTWVPPEWFSRAGRLAPEARFAAIFLSTLILTSIVSTITYRLIEQPGIRLGKLLISRSERQRI